MNLLLFAILCALLGALALALFALLASTTKAMKKSDATQHTALRVLAVAMAVAMVVIVVCCYLYPPCA